MVTKENQNDDIPHGEPQYYTYKKIAKVIPGQRAHDACRIDIQIFVCEQRDPPKYRNRPSISWRTACISPILFAPTRTDIAFLPYHL